MAGGVQPPPLTTPRPGYHMLDLILLLSGPAFLAGSVALALWTDWREGRAGGPAGLEPARRERPRPRLVR